MELLGKGEKVAEGKRERGPSRIFRGELTLKVPYCSIFFLIIVVIFFFFFFIQCDLYGR